MKKRIKKSEGRFKPGLSPVDRGLMEVYAELRVSPPAAPIGKTVAWRLVGTGELASVQIGRLRRVSKDAIHDYAAGLITTSRKSA